MKKFFLLIILLLVSTHLFSQETKNLYEIILKNGEKYVGTLHTIESVDNQRIATLIDSSGQEYKINMSDIKFQRNINNDEVKQTTKKKEASKIHTPLKKINFSLNLGLNNISGNADVNRHWFSSIKPVINYRFHNNFLIELSYQFNIKDYSENYRAYTIEEGIVDEQGYYRGKKTRGPYNAELIYNLDGIPNMKILFKLNDITYLGCGISYYSGNITREKITTDISGSPVEIEKNVFKLKPKVGYDLTFSINPIVNKYLFFIISASYNLINTEIDGDEYLHRYYNTYRYGQGRCLGEFILEEFYWEENRKVKLNNFSINIGLGIAIH